jgi:hypothetical protein
MRSLHDSTEKIQRTLEGKSTSVRSVGTKAIEATPLSPIDTGDDVVLPGGKGIKMVASW